MRFFFLLSVLTSLIFGCSVTTVITPQSSSDSYHEANDNSGAYTADIVMAAGAVHAGHSVRMATDSVRWKLIEPEMLQTLRASGIEVLPERHRALPTWSVREVRVHNTDRGTREGFFFGLVGAATVSLICQTAQIHFLPPGFIGMKVYNAQWLVAAFFGGVTGGTVGSLIGSTCIIRFEHDPTPLQPRK
jgi:hypothetical protein